MCNLSRVTKRKKATIYKLVTKDNAGNYYSIPARLPIKIGKVNSKTIKNKDLDNPTSRFYNHLAINRTMGYKRLKDAKDNYGSLIILKIEISGSIAENIGPTMFSPSEPHILAGTEILSFKEVKY